MSKVKKVITRLVLRDGHQTLDVGNEDADYGVVELISFRGDRHQTTGASYINCYVVKFVNSTVELVVPIQSVLFVVTDVKPPEHDEDVGNVPELPDGEE